MSIGNALFVPTSIVVKREYWIGVAILIAIAAAIYGFSIWLMRGSSGLSGMMMGSMASMLLLPLVYTWFCLIGGRLRDAGASPWYFLLGFFGYYILSSVLSVIFVMPDMMGAMEGMIENMPTEAEMEEDPSAYVSDMFDSQTEMMGKMLPKQMVATTIASLLTATPFGFLHQKLDKNPYREMTA